MDTASVVNLNELIDGRTVRTSTIVFLAVVTLAMVGDGFDLSAIGLVAPELVKEWHIAPAQLAPVFHGRPRRHVHRRATVGLCRRPYWTQENHLDRTVHLRRSHLWSRWRQIRWFISRFCDFLTGIGLGGMIPNILALTAEIGAEAAARHLYDNIVIRCACRHCATWLGRGSSRA